MKNLLFAVAFVLIAAQVKAESYDPIKTFVVGEELVWTPFFVNDPQLTLMNKWEIEAGTYTATDFAYRFIPKGPGRDFGAPLLVALIDVAYRSSEWGHEPTALSEKKLELDANGILMRVSFHLSF